MAMDTCACMNLCMCVYVPMCVCLYECRQVGMYVSMLLRRRGERSSHRKVTIRDGSCASDRPAAGRRHQAIWQRAKHMHRRAPPHN